MREMGRVWRDGRWEKDGGSGRKREEGGRVVTHTHAHTHTHTHYPAHATLQPTKVQLLLFVLLLPVLFGNDCFGGCKDTSRHCKQQQRQINNTSHTTQVDAVMTTAHDTKH